MNDNELIYEQYKQLLNESMTAYIAEVDPKHTRQYSTILDIIYAICNPSLYREIEWTEFEEELYKRDRAIETFSPDGYDAMESTGTINFYVEGLTPKLIGLAVEKIRGKLDAEGFEYDFIPLERRKDKGDVIRFSITHNPETDKAVDEAPEVQYSNANMRAVLSSIGLDEIADNYGGSVSASELMLRIQNASQASKEAEARPRYHSDMEKFRNPDQEHKGATMIDPGLSADDIDHRLSALYDLAGWAKQRGYETIAIG